MEAFTETYRSSTAHRRYVPASCAEMEERQASFKRDLEKTRQKLAELPADWESQQRAARMKREENWQRQGGFLSSTSAAHSGEDAFTWPFYCGIAIIALIFVVIFFVLTAGGRNWLHGEDDDLLLGDW